jgi:hypothetical protein
MPRCPLVCRQYLVSSSNCHLQLSQGNRRELSRQMRRIMCHSEIEALMSQMEAKPSAGTGMFVMPQRSIDLVQHNGSRLKSGAPASLTSDFLVTEFEETFALAIFAFHFWFACILFHALPIRCRFFPQQSPIRFDGSLRVTPSIAASASVSFSFWQATMPVTRRCFPDNDVGIPCSIA